MHCILAHHGEYEFGSPKKPAIMEAVALNFADNTDAKLQTFTELMDNTTETGWLASTGCLIPMLLEPGWSNLYHPAAYE